MMKFIASIFIIFLSFYSSAQHQSSLGLSVGLDYSNTTVRSIIDLDDDDYGVAWGGLQGKINYRIEGQFNYRVSKNVMIRSGLGYTQVGYRHNFLDLTASNREGHKSTEHQYIEVPLIGRYEIAKSKVSFYLELGVSTLFYLRTKTTWDRGEEEVIFDEFEYQKRKAFRLALISGIGMNYDMSKTVQLFIQPTFRYYPNIEGQPFFEFNFKSIGLDFGVRKALSFT